MNLLIEELYDALKEGNVSDEKARAAARAVAEYRHEIGDLRQDIQDLRATQRLHSWMLGFNLALSVAILFRLFMP